MINKQVFEFPITYTNGFAGVALGWGAHETVANECHNDLELFLRVMEMKYEQTVTPQQVSVLTQKIYFQGLIYLD